MVHGPRDNGHCQKFNRAPSVNRRGGLAVPLIRPKLAELMSWFSRTQRQFLAEETGRQGMVFVDLTDRLRAAAGTASPDRLLYFPSILHLTERGHREVAGGLAGPIRELLLKGESPVSAASGRNPGR